MTLVSVTLAPERLRSLIRQDLTSRASIMPRLPGVEFMTTTANGIDGYDVVQTFGVVRGIVVRSRSVFKGKVNSPRHTLGERTRRSVDDQPALLEVLLDKPGLPL